MLVFNCGIRCTNSHSYLTPVSPDNSFFFSIEEYLKHCLTDRNSCICSSWVLSWLSGVVFNILFFGLPSVSYIKINMSCIVYYSPVGVLINEITLPFDPCGYRLFARFGFDQWKNWLDDTFRLIHWNFVLMWLEKRVYFGCAYLELSDLGELHGNKEQKKWYLLVNS